MNIQRISVKEVLYPEHFNGNDLWFVYNVAILVLAKPISFHNNISPICIEKLTNSDNTIGNGLKGKLVGWSEVKKETRIFEFQTESYATCKNELPEEYRRFIAGDKICTLNYTSDIFESYESDGAGLYFLKSDVQYLRGIISGTALFLGDESFVVFTNIKYYFDFILNAIQNHGI